MRFKIVTATGIFYCEDKEVMRKIMDSNPSFASVQDKDGVKHMINPRYIISFKKE